MESLVVITEFLVELVLVAAAILLAVALRPWRPEVRFVLAVCGLALVTVAISLFILIAYPKETLWFLAVCAVMAEAEWGYPRVTGWLAPGTRWVTGGSIQRALSRALGRLGKSRPRSVRE